MKTITNDIYKRAAAAAMAAALATGQRLNKDGIIRVAVLEDEGVASDFGVVSRQWYEEGCSESEFICQAVTYRKDNGEIGVGIDE